MTTTAPRSESDDPGRTEAPAGAPPARSRHSSDAHDGPAVRLVGRRTERAAVEELLSSVRAGLSRTLVIRSEPGTGKSALLHDAVEAAADLQILRMTAVESERALAFARRMRTGQVDINGAAFNPSAPFGGYGRSGVGHAAITSSQSPPVTV